MAIKSAGLAALARGEGCLGKAADDEPLFVLRANDPLAAIMADIWCTLAGDVELLLHEPDKIAEARALAQEMRLWRSHRGLTALPF